MLKIKLFPFELSFIVFFASQLTVTKFLPFWAFPLSFLLLLLLKAKIEGLRVNLPIFLLTELVILFVNYLPVQIVAIFLACLGIYYFPVFHYPDPTGPYKVGLKSLVIDGQDVAVFYPTEETTKDVRYYPHDEHYVRFFEASKIFRDNIPYPIHRMVFGIMENRKLGVNLNASLAENCEEKFPIVVFSHGLAANKHLYTMFHKEWASNGYVVFSVDHSEQIFMEVETYEEFVKQRKPQLQVRKSTISKTIDYVVNEANMKKLFGTSNLLDLNKLFLGGHSFGGATVAEVAQMDKRCHAVLLLDPWMWPCEEKLFETPLEQPFLSLRTHQYDITENRGEATKKHLKLNKPIKKDKVVCGYFKDTTHNTMTDLIYSIPREMSFVGMMSSLSQAKEFHFNYTRLTQSFLDTLKRMDNETLIGNNVEGLVLDRFNGHLKNHNFQNTLILDTPESVLHFNV